MNLFSYFFVDAELKRIIMLGLIFVDTYHQIIEQKLLDSCGMACGELIEVFFLLDIIPCIFFETIAVRLIILLRIHSAMFM